MSSCGLSGLARGDEHPACATVHEHISSLYLYSWTLAGFRKGRFAKGKEKEWKLGGGGETQQLSCSNSTTSLRAVRWRRDESQMTITGEHNVEEMFCRADRWAGLLKN